MGGSDRAQLTLGPTEHREVHRDLATLRGWLDRDTADQFGCNERLGIGALEHVDDLRRLLHAGEVVGHGCCLTWFVWLVKRAGTVTLLSVEVLADG